MPRHWLIRADALRLPLAPSSIDCCVTSPPYYGLRDYGAYSRPDPREIGKEATSEQYVQKLVHIFRQIRVALRRQGVLWLNLGDSYNAYNGNRGASRSLSGATDGHAQQLPRGRGLTDPTRKNKDLLGVPWRVALALQADGWWLRGDIIHSKPNSMPESVTDRPTASHEYVFLLTKSERYYYNYLALREPSISNHNSGTSFKRAARLSYSDQNGARGNDQEWVQTEWRRGRSVWSIPTRNGPKGHRAVFTPELARKCIVGGCPPGGLVLDPFAGSFTVAELANGLGMDSIGMDLYWNYLQEGKERLLCLPP